MTRGVLTVACAAVAFAGLPSLSGGGAGTGLVATANAQEARSIDSFYEDLAPYGDWVEHPDHDYVFIPAGVAPDWRPYTVGQWIWTDEYGWYWESEEPFGWATFHYGRWGYDDEFGWYWVPGDEWAPAWVNWRDSEDDSVTGWAPIAPPSRGYAIGAVAEPEPVVQESWVFVPTARMVSPRVYQYAYPVRETVVYVNRTPRRWYLPRDRYYVNRPFARDRVVKYVGVGGVPVRKVTVVNRRPAWGVRNNDAIFVYRPRYDNRVVVRKPPKVVKKVEVVKKVKVDKTVIRKDVDVKKVNVREDNRKDADRQQRREDRAKQERKEEKARDDQRKQRADQREQDDRKSRQEQKQRQEDKAAKQEKQQQKDDKAAKRQKQDENAARQEKQQRQEQKAAKQEKQQRQEQNAARQEKQQRQEQKAAKQEKQQQKAEKQKARCDKNPNKCN